MEKEFENNEEYENEDIEEALGVIDELIRIIKENRPSEIMYYIDEKREKEVKESVNTIYNLIKDFDEEAVIESKFDELFCLDYCVSIISDGMPIAGDEMISFIKAIKVANTFDVNPRLDGKLEVGLTYRGIRVRF